MNEIAMCLTCHEMMSQGKPPVKWYCKKCGDEIRIAESYNFVSSPKCVKTAQPKQPRKPEGKE